MSMPYLCSKHGPKTLSTPTRFSLRPREAQELICHELSTKTPLRKAATNPVGEHVGCSLRQGQVELSGRLASWP